MDFGAAQRQRAWALLTVMVLLLGLVFSFGFYPTKIPGGADSRLGATIKTQKAADAVPNGIKGIDVSEYQGSINWSQVADSGIKFAICRASIGTKTDKYFHTNATGANDNGILVGAYHYAKFSTRSSMLNEAEYFLNVIGDVKITYPVFLDLELHQGLSRNKLTELAVEFMDTVKAGGYTVMFYSYANFYRDRLNVSMMSDYDFWVANYMQEPSNSQKIWQYTSVGSVGGIKGNVDLDVAYADLALKKKVTVNKAISTSIKETLNARHDAGLPLDGLDMAQMKQVVVTVLQSELNRQINAGLAVTGEMDADTLFALETVPFTYGETSGNMTYLIQVMLFYKGHYTEQLSGAFDDHMVAALKLYQKEISLPVTGETDRETLWYLFR